MQIVYFSHSYRDQDQRVNDFFSRLLESEGVLLSLDPPSKTVNGAKLQRHLNSSDGMVAVLTVREGGVSPFIRYETSLCLRSRKPLLVFVEDVLPDGLIPNRVLQRRFSRTAFLRQVREHRHAVTVFKSYLGEEPPPRYQPEVSQRSCVIVGGNALAANPRRALEETVESRGYRVVAPAQIVSDEAKESEAFTQADAALAFLDDLSPESQYARGLIGGASVPTIEITSHAGRRARNVPQEFWPVLAPVQDRGREELCDLVARHLSLVEEDFLELPDQGRVDRYFQALVDIGASRGRYSERDHEQVVSVVMGDQYTVGQAGAVGPGSQARDITFAQTWNQVSSAGDAQTLASELARLRQHLRVAGDDPEQDIAIATLAEAEIQAKQGNGPAALERLSRLARVKATAKWVLGAANTIGTTVAAAALQSVLGL